MINSITCDTSFEALLKESVVENYLSKIYDSINLYINELNNTINLEKNTGGLSAKSVSVQGSGIKSADGAILAVAADKFLASVEIENAFKKYSDLVMDIYKNQKNKELATLIDKIDTKLIALKQKEKEARIQVNICLRKMERNYSVDQNYYAEYQAASNNLAYYENKIKEYEEKKKTAQEMII